MAYHEEIQDNLWVQKDIMGSINRQKSQELWLKNEDKISKFFHVSTLVRRRHNRINAIDTDSGWITNEREIAEAFITNFKELFESSNLEYQEELRNFGERVITDAKNSMLTNIPNLAEIKHAVWSLHPFKSLDLTATQAHSTILTG